MRLVAVNPIRQGKRFQAALLAWFDVERRRLPWREEPSVYRTVVSEFMLQQTQVKTMLPYFARWMEALPDFAALAAADEARVLRLWEGLGYYSRARNLHRLGRELAARDTLPTTPSEWRELPGIGPYTAAAVTSISFGAEAAVVDGNVVRILTRLTADARAFANSGEAAKVLTPLAEALLNRTRPGDHNQAMMELGATVCLRRKPLCTVCPVREFCAGARSGEPEAFPRLAAKVIEQVSVIRAWCRLPDANGRLLLHRAAGSARRLAGQHELPTAEQLGLGDDTVMRGALLAKRKRGITRFAITEFIHEATPEVLAAAKRVAANAGAGGAELVWVTPEELAELTLSGPHRRWITELLDRR